MGRACSTHCNMRNIYQIITEENSVEDVGVD
jgi:hypothetical protein